jgi:hypothetical protein
VSPARSHRRIPLLGVAVVLVVTGLAWWWIGSGGGEPGPPATRGAAADAVSARLPDADGPDLPAGGTATGAAVGNVRPLLEGPDKSPGESPSSASPSPAYPTGRFVVRMTWEEDGTPAEGVHVRLISYDVRVPHDVRYGGETDGDGAWVCGRAPAGASILWHDRGDATRVMVAGGGETALDLAIPPGIDLTGRVVAVPDTVVPDATVWLVTGNWLRLPAARTDAEGRFALRDVSRFVEVAATARGHAPSMRFVLDKQAPTAPLEIELPLGGPCGDLGLCVRDEAGRAVAGARIDLAVPMHCVRPTSSWREFERETWRRTTDAAGRIVEPDLPEGSTTLTVIADGFAKWFGSETVEAGRTTEVEVVLLPEAVVRGTVRDTAGRPVPGAGVSAHLGGLPFPLASATSGPDGAYELRGVRDEATLLRAVLGARESVEATRPVEVTPGDVLEWDPVLDLGRRLDGRVLTVDGRPAGRHRLQFRTLHPPEPWSLDVDTDAEGRFTLGLCPPGPYLVHAFDWARDDSAPLAVLRDVEAAGDEVVVRLPADTQPSAYITTRLLASDGSPPASMRLFVLHAAQHTATARAAPARLDEATGTTAFGPLVPGDYRVVIVDTSGWGEPLGDLLVTDLRAGETRDLGVLTPPERGRIVVRVEREGGGPGAAPRLSLVTVGDAGGGVHRNAEWSRDGDIWTAEVGAGAYRLHAFAPDIAPRAYDLPVEPGRGTELVIVAGPIVRADITFELPAEGPDPPHLTVSVRDAAGATVCEGGTHETVPEWKAGGKPMVSGFSVPSFPPDEDPAGRPRRRVLSWFFAPGSYTVSGRFEGGPAVERVFDVPDDPTATVRVDLSLH